VSLSKHNRTLHFKAEKTLGRASSLVRKINSLLFKKKKTDSLNQKESDKSLIYNLAPSKIPNSEQLKQVGHVLSVKEKLIIRICLLLALIGLVYLGTIFFNKHIQLLPKSGGTYTEGVVGYPQTINPLYDVNRDVDSDLGSLIYSSLFTYNENGQLVGDLASSWQQVDSKTYIVNLKPNVSWQTGENLTADDVIFTINLLQDPDYDSPLQQNLAAVNVSKISDTQLQFTLQEPYAGFLNLLTFGIMPQSIWQNVSPEEATLTELNIKPIGSGRYKFSSLVKNKNGDIKEYHLVANDNYYGQKPYITNLVFKFYPDYNSLIAALNDNVVDGISYLPLDQKSNLLAQNSLNFHILDLPEESAIFFNQNHDPALAVSETRQALALAIDKNAIVNKIFNGTYHVIDSPILPNSFAYNSKLNHYVYDPTSAMTKLDQAGWNKIELSGNESASSSPVIKAILNYASSTQISPQGLWRYKQDKRGSVSLLTIQLSVVDGSQAQNAAELVKGYWDAVGVQTSINPVSSSNIQNTVIASREYDAIFYSEIVGADPDLYAFWHSSQANNNGNGLNLADYQNKTADQLLEDARATSDQKVRAAKYQSFQELMVSDIPAIFLYSHTYTYVQSKKVKGFAGTSIIEPSDRLAGISNWYINTASRWSW
jgi:peptide/nickel transport system substrate-binding protein